MSASERGPEAGQEAGADDRKWTVLKFGGTSLGLAERFEQVAAILEKQSTPIMVVVSAVGGVTTALGKLVEAAQTRDNKDHYLEGIEEIRELHEELAHRLLPEDARDTFLTSLASSLRDVRDLLRAAWIARSTSERFQDFVLGQGELWAAQLLWSLLRSRGRNCSWMDTRDVLVARRSHGSSPQKIVDWDLSQKLLDEWRKSNPTEIIIATGFIARDSESVPITFGRNGSDFSASVFGRLLNAKEVQIWTDVDGIYTADPRVVQEAVLLEELSYQEAAELAYFGASVLHPDTMAPTMEANVPISIKNTFKPLARGTVVTNTSLGSSTSSSKRRMMPWGAINDSKGVRGFSTVKDVALVNVEGTGMIGVPGIASRLFTALYEKAISCILIAQASSEYSICAAVPGPQGEEAAAAVRQAFQIELDEGLVSDVDVVSNLSILAMVGENMQRQPGVSSRLFRALANGGISVRAMAQGSSEHNVSVVVDSKHESRALRTAHSAFYLSDQTLSIGIIGSGVVGTALMRQILHQRKSLKERMGVDLRVTGLTTSKKMSLSADIDSDDWLKTEDVLDADLDAFAAHVNDPSLPNAVIVDCTASEVVTEKYEEWLNKGIHIVTPNKKANSGPYPTYLALRQAMSSANSHFFYEANVGAGLPIITTIRDQLHTGDDFLEIQGIFSGTLSYIFNEFDGTEPFSAVVTKAKSLGYTEPDPRDDLSGMDVARKVVILAREIGIQAELDDVPVASLVPEELQGSDVSIDEFMKRLPDFDKALTEMANEAAEDEELLRYVGVIDAVSEKCSVELRRYSKSHPFGRLKGSDNIVTFRTKRYDDQPLVVQGPGAGADVTAAGVFSDVLRLAAHLGSPSSYE
ncbi:hypothetical protein NDN08_006050 [Rhodosorus marinus]|uniref:ACT domain-containing protein n=1 Tax=Rhodosorus marinus TaxID=101924 RepID=A0AAV8UJK1_9RHOD|nr:hypothetical protein NDN08_006050 [Rhodosorus marinus]